MFNKTNKIKLLLSLLLLSFFFIGCKTTQTITRNYIQHDVELDTAEEPQAPYVISNDVHFEDIEDPDYKYIFIRLYNPVYSNPFYIANILQGGLNLTKTEDVPDLSHSAINFTLDDCFLGLTFGGKYQLAEENCRAPLDNKYMKHCDPSKSEQITYALKVSEKEFEDTKLFIEKYAASTKLKYASMQNVKIGIWFIGKRYFTNKKYRQFGTAKYPKGAKNKIVDINSEEELDYKFVCSTFLAYVLYNTVDSVRQFFDEYNIKYQYMNVTDLTFIPGLTPLFYSNWETYEQAAKLFVEQYPEFEKYLTE